MKTKLLKKIRKRFDWYITPGGNYVIIDKKLEKTHLLDLKKALNYADFKKEDLGVSEDTFIWRITKEIMTIPFGYKFEDIFFKRSVQKFNKTKAGGFKKSKSIKKRRT